MPRHGGSTIPALVLAIGIGQFVAVEARQVDAQQSRTFREFAGNYRLPSGDMLGINLFRGDDGKPTLLYADYASAIVRRLSESGDDLFTMGPAFGVASPVELTVRFIRDDQRAVTAITVQRSGQRELRASRLAFSSREVTFNGSEGATLAGTLFTPPTPGPHPAIVLLHGSGRLTRDSFGPYPHFFTSLGLAVLIYDKRASGESTGAYLPRTTYYPEVFLEDAIAAVQFLQQQDRVDAKRIGLWGTSEGGMLTTQVAARKRDVAYIINSSGFVMPLWEQVLYNIEAQLRADGFSPDDVADAVSFQRLAIQVMRTGEAWNEYMEAQDIARKKQWWSAYFGSSAGYSSLETIRWQWDHVYSFDPLPALRSVTCPVLGVFGALDTSTPARTVAANMERVLREGGNGDVTMRVFESANHPLMEAHTGGNGEIPGLKGMAPGVFDTLRSWLSARVGPVRP
jgi:pimeloyl-ACP methyl ester carboxylesterase